MIEDIDISERDVEDKITDKYLPILEKAHRRLSEATSAAGDGEQKEIDMEQYCLEEEMAMLDEGESFFHWYELAAERLEELGVTDVYDIGCGSFAIQSLAFSGRDISYKGVEAIKPIKQAQDIFDEIIPISYIYQEYPLALDKKKDGEVRAAVSHLCVGVMQDEHGLGKMLRQAAHDFDYCMFEIFLNRGGKGESGVKPLASAMGI